MDPDAAFEIMTSPTTTLDEKGQAAMDILGWMALGGPAPIIGGVPMAHQRKAAVEQCKITLSQVLDAMPEED